MDLISKNKKNRHCRDARPCVCTCRLFLFAARLYVLCVFICREFGLKFFPCPKEF